MRIWQETGVMLDSFDGTLCKFCVKGVQGFRGMILVRSRFRDRALEGGRMDTVLPSGRSFLTNCFAFASIVGDNEDICRGIIERVLGCKIARLDFVQGEAGVTQVLKRSVRCDVLAQNSHAVFDVEMQVAVDVSIPRRARYSHSMLDARCLRKSEQFSGLPDAYVIFICLFDPLGLGLPVCTVRKRVDQAPQLDYAAGQVDVIVNATGDLSLAAPELAALLEYLLSGDKSSGDPFVAHVDDILTQRLEDEEWRREVITFEEKLAWDCLGAATRAREEGREEGHEEAAEEFMERAIRTGVMTPAQAREFFIFEGPHDATAKGGGAK
ncbi:Rpn family recombination-promoting nuclease/putative transposase [Eggerthellaceae bacterium zg-893]|nr:Rpn family recombination-promoting nuclease/putative transposase [Eggerthellaceae bacterium zg-893]